MHQLGLSPGDQGYFYTEYVKAFPERSGLTEQIYTFSQEPGKIIGSKAMPNITSLKRVY